MAEITENKQQRDKLLETEILTKIAQVASSTLELREILDTIIQTLVDTLKKDVCSLYFIKPEKKAICIEATRSIKKKSIVAFCLPTDEGIIAEVVKERQPFSIDDIREDLRFKDMTPPTAVGGNFRSILAVPIVRDNTTIGVITLQTRKPYTYTQDEIDLLTIISHNLSAAMRTAELYKSVKTQLDELKITHEISKAIASILSIDEVLPYVCEEVSKLFNVKGCILRLLEGEHFGLLIKASYGLPEKIKQKMSLRLGEGIAGWVAKTGKPLLVDDVSEMPENLRVPVIEATSVLCVPLTIGEHIIGTLGLYDKQDEWGVTTFTDDDLNKLNTFASAASIAIENARLYRAEVEKEKEILSLYLEVTQTKDYLKSIIDNSADAIITSDTNGIITSWNEGAEKIYGYTEDEVMGKFLPMVPPFLIEEEKNSIKSICQKNTLRDTETVRQTKDGRLIEVSLTLSPILDSSGKVTGISGISRDISEKKRVEKELIRRNQELSRLFFINSVIRSTLDLDKLLRMVLTVVTMSNGLGFNRAILFLVEESQNILKGVMGVGPATPEEAENIWLFLEGKSLESIIEEIESGPLRKDSYLDKLSQELSINLDKDCILSRCIKEKMPFNIQNTKTEPLVSSQLIQKIGVDAFAIVPLITRDKAIGAIWVDNFITRRVIKDENLQFLMGFVSHIASAIENARLFENVSLAQSELKNIFESISDMVYFTDKDYTLKRINQAVVKKIEKPENEIIGKKCYEVFHGKDKPWELCPHVKTIDYEKPIVEEIEDPYLGGTFVISNSPIFDSSGNFVGTVHVSRDITELHTLRERVTQSERMAALGELAARVAHEIRNPLISIGGFARRLEKKLTGDTQEYAKIIVNEVSRLENILKEILGFVRGTKEIRSDVKINELINNIIDFITPEIHQRGNRIIKDLSELPITVGINPDRIREALLNLIKNANQATDHGTLTIKTRREDKEAVIEISDTGCGIKQEDLKNIFNPFFTTKLQGTGLGLAVTHKIIQECNGKIKVKSVYDEGKDTKLKKQTGTTFKISLPLEET